MYIIITLIIFITDIISKEWICNNFLIYEKKHIFNFINIIHLHNHGISFGFFCTEYKWILQIIFFINSLSIIIIIIILSTNSSLINNKIKNSYFLIIGGAFGNLYDRIHHGFVIDFIDLHIYKLHFAIFNIADGSIFIGILLIILRIFINFLKKSFTYM